MTLTRRQTEILQLLADGKTNVQVGEALYLSHRTVKAHMFHARRINGAANTTHLVATALRKGLIV